MQLCRQVHGLTRGQWRRIICICLVTVVLPLKAGQDRKIDTVFQYSAINALLAGVYDGDLTLESLAEHGNTGIGTINGIDGEMIVLDGVFYSIKSDGLAYKLAPGEKTPFAVVAFLNAEVESVLKETSSVDVLTKHLDTLIDAHNAIQVIRIDGSFTQLTLRSEPKQTRPYRPLAELMAEEQVKFELNDVKGTMIGFRMPDYMTGLNVPGYHFHFITDDRKRGGHVLNLQMISGQVTLDTQRGFNMVLPNIPLFNEAMLGSDREKELESVEQN
ncbi:alpha-acetolactate decarboxylase [Gammaproteobacteria bacterium 45_16_T64]|nr:alpha-acetolactate decarboxylase [Gammaproteobacteria bacterium 45_16_T64]